LQAFLERAPDGHRFADAFHLRGERGIGLRKFLKGKARNLGDDVINARFEARGGFARDVVLEFVEQVADGKFGGNSTLSLNRVPHILWPKVNKELPIPPK
jgi:hypothetical protein